MQTSPRGMAVTSGLSGRDDGIVARVIAYWREQKGDILCATKLGRGGRDVLSIEVDVIGGMGF
jgi:hypothetical protein